MKAIRSRNAVLDLRGRVYMSNEKVKVCHTGDTVQRQMVRSGPRMNGTIRAMLVRDITEQLEIRQGRMFPDHE